MPQIICGASIKIDMSDSEEHSLNPWDQAAATFDQEPDHGLRDPDTRQAWAKRLHQWLPTTPCRVLDVGCGTGSLSVLLAQMGHTVIGIDRSLEMLKLAARKARDHGVSVAFAQMDAAQPSFVAQHFDVLICRHVLWALPQPQAVLARWADGLAITGRFVLIEGFWMTGAGLHAQTLLDLLPPHLNEVQRHDLSQQANLWGKSVSDERYALTATRRWFHGSPEPLDTLRVGSSITPTETVARGFSHKPEFLSIDNDGAAIHHNGTRAGYLYQVDEMLTPNDVEIHSATPKDLWFEWLVKRPVRVKLLRETQVLDSERLTEAELIEIRARQKGSTGNSISAQGEDI